MEKAHIQHLYRRAGFDILPKELEILSGKDRKSVVAQLFESSKKMVPLTVPTPKIDAYLDSNTQIDRKSKAFKELIRTSRQKHVVFNRAWVNRMATTGQGLRERMTLFWANHFVVRSNNILFSQQFNNTLRTHALGNFKEFVIAVAKEPAMLDYLNNQQNRKGAPNENFARELMELFTLGVGHYTEMDIKEAARAFTGWRHDSRGTFKLTNRIHDDGEKSFLGKTGLWNGEDIVRIILEQPACAHFIAEKIYRHFVNEETNSNHIEELAIVFRKEYQIADVMKYLFMADWFYDPKHMGHKIKSPVDLLVGLMKTVPFTWDKAKELKYIERLLGQVLLEPPNVAGWAEGRSWIDANTLMIRLKLPSVLLNDGEIAFDVKGEFEDSFEAFDQKNNFRRKLAITKNWNRFKANYGALTYDVLVFYILGASVSKETNHFLKTLEKEDQRNFCIQLMSLPEYQLC